MSSDEQCPQLETDLSLQNLLGTCILHLALLQLVDGMGVLVCWHMYIFSWHGLTLLRLISDPIVLFTFTALLVYFYCSFRSRQLPVLII